MTFKFKRFPSAKYGKEETAMLKNLFVLEANASPHGGSNLAGENRAVRAMQRYNPNQFVPATRTTRQLQAVVGARRR